MEGLVDDGRMLAVQVVDEGVVHNRRRFWLRQVHRGIGSCRLVIDKLLRFGHAAAIVLSLIVHFDEREDLGRLVLAFRQGDVSAFVRGQHFVMAGLDGTVRDALRKPEPTDAGLVVVIRNLLEF